jgi:Domain of unknown function (DUF5615)
VKVLFDTCVPRPLRNSLPGHDINTTQEMGWDRLRNGEFIHVAEEAFDALITSDQSLKYQQHLTTRMIGIVVLPTNHLPLVLQLAPKIVFALSGLSPGSVVEIQL